MKEWGVVLRNPSSAQFSFSHASAKAEHDLSSLSSVADPEGAEGAMIPPPHPPTGAVKISHKKMATKGGHIDFHVSWPLPYPAPPPGPNCLANWPIDQNAVFPNTMLTKHYLFLHVNDLNSANSVNHDKIQDWYHNQRHSISDNRYIP